MERNLLIDSAMYTNQIEIIRIIAKSLPINYRLYVKESPAQASREWRSKKEYKEIQNIPNVTLIQPTVLGRELIENSSLVISIAGTSSLEATFHQKPSIIFGNVIYNSILFLCILFLFHFIFFEKRLLLLLRYSIILKRRAL